jgi:hypothetical protein
MYEAIWGLIGTAVGAGASILTTLISTSNAVSLQKSENMLNRNETMRGFQRSNLLELQLALHECSRLVARAHFEDLKAHRAGGDWGKSLLYVELDEQIRESMQKMTILRERVANNDLRDAMYEYGSHLTSILLAKSKPEAEARSADAARMFEDVMQKTGACLRRYY